MHAVFVRATNIMTAKSADETKHFVKETIFTLAA